MALTISPRGLGVAVGLLLMAAGVAVLAGSWGHGNPGPPKVFISHPEGPTVPGQLIVRFRDDASPREREAALEAAGATVVRQHLAPGYVSVAVPPGREEEAGRLLAQQPAVQSAEEDVIWTPYFIPNDEYFQQAQWNLQLVQAPEAWDVNRGAGVIVAVVDTGIAYEDCSAEVCGAEYRRAPDLAGTTFLAPYDFYANDPHANDDSGHGTHVAGTIAETTNNFIGVAGLAFEAKIMPLKVCGPLESQGYGCPSSNIADAVVYAVNVGARVINLSLGGPGQVTDLQRQAFKYAKDANVVVVAAAGNGGSDGVGDPFLDYPAAIASVIAVGATKTTGERSRYSNYGLGEEGELLDLVAPGGDYAEASGILQNTYRFACPAGGATDFTQFDYCYQIGTSMAAAHVSAAAAMIRSVFPKASAVDVRIILKCSARDVGAPGFDYETGAGLLQVFEALRDDDQDGTQNCVDPVFNTPMPTPSPTPTPTPTPTPSPPPNECLAPSPTPSPSPAPTPTPTETPPAEPTLEPTATPLETPGPSGTPPPTDAPAPTDTPSPGATETSAPLASVETLAAQSAASLVACGDVDCDGDVDAVDALHILRWVAGLPVSAGCMGKGYVDCDGDLDAVDALMVLRYIAGLPVPLPTGCPGLGYP